jgi:hypothetical protein
MSYVRFASICDGCGVRSPEYSPWPHCRECLNDTCPECELAGEHDEEAGKTLCLSCHSEIASEIDEARARLVKEYEV